MNYFLVFVVFAFLVGWTLGTTPPPPCPNKNEVNSNCDELTCETRHQKQNCTNQYWTCICKPGYVRDGSGLCIPRDDCHFCPRDEKYVDCVKGYCKAKTCDDLGYPLKCSKVEKSCEGGCVCRDGYVRNCAGFCITGDQCPGCGGDKNARPGCGTRCGNSCSDYKLRPVILCPAILCVKDPNTCICRENHVYDASINKCVLPENCPVEKCGEHEYYDEYKKTCVCKKGYERREGKCVKKCGRNEHWTNCINPCPKLPKGAVCRIKCISGCICDSGYIKINDECVKSCPKNEHPCKGDKEKCDKGCACDKGYKRRSGVCTNIVCGKHEHYSPCINPCPKLPKGAVCRMKCIAGCICNSGYIKINDNCVKSCPKNEHPCKGNKEKCVKGCACDKGYKRKSGVCTNIVCGKHEHYSPCINPCPKGAQCFVGCIEGCLCDKGYERNGDICVRKSCGEVKTVEKESTSSSSLASESDENSRSEYSKVKNADGSYTETSNDEQNSSSSLKQDQSEHSSTKTTITSRPADDRPSSTPGRPYTGPPSRPPPSPRPGSSPGAPSGPPPGTNPEDCGPLEDYLEQTNECHRSCADLKPTAPPSQCLPRNGCFCKSGYVRRDRNGTGPCVSVDSCPK